MSTVESAKETQPPVKKTHVVEPDVVMLDDSEDSPFKIYSYPPLEALKKKCETNYSRLVYDKV